MIFNHDKQDGISIFRLSVRKLDTSNSGLLKGELTSTIVHEKIRRLIVDLTEVENCDSSGLSSLLIANRLIQENEGAIRLVASGKISGLITVTKLNHVLQTSDSVAAALSELKKEN